MAEVEPLAAEVAAVGTLRSAEAEAELAARHSNDMRRLGEAVDALVAARRAAGGGDNGGEGGGEGDAGDAPDEFLDPILATLMADPVLLPDSRVTVDRATIERHLLSSATDPFSRAPLARHQLQPDGELRRRIEAWRAQRAKQRRRGAGPAEG
jgi:ubiquitin conjugation factor E4 B